jgi:hypothetical protein
MYCHLGIQLSRGECWDPIGRFNLSKCFACSKPVHEFPTSYVVIFLLCSVSSIKMSCDCSFRWYWWNWWPPLFKLSFHNVKFRLSEFCQILPQCWSICEDCILMFVKCENKLYRFSSYCWLFCTCLSIFILTQCLRCIISNLKWESLEQRRAKARTVLMYKIIHNLVEVRTEHLLIPSDCRTRGCGTQDEIS